MLTLPILHYSFLYLQFEEKYYKSWLVSEHSSHGEKRDMLNIALEKMPQRYRVTDKNLFAKKNNNCKMPPQRYTVWNWWVPKMKVKIKHEFTPFFWLVCLFFCCCWFFFLFYFGLFLLLFTCALLELLKWWRIPHPYCTTNIGEIPRKKRAQISKKIVMFTIIIWYWRCVFL